MNMEITIENHIPIKLKQDNKDLIFDAGKIHIKKKTELAEALEELNKDIAEDQSGLTAIDMRANLHYTEISALLTIDFLARAGFLPPEVTSLTRQKKRLSVSKAGIGRNQVVDLVTGNKDKPQFAHGLVGVAVEQAKAENQSKQ